MPRGFCVQSRRFWWKSATLALLAAVAWCGRVEAAAFGVSLSVPGLMAAQRTEIAPAEEPDSTLAEPGGAPAGPADPPPPQRLDWNSGSGKSYLVPAIEVPGFLILLNLYDRLVYPDERSDGRKTYSTTFSSTWEHLHRQNWQFDRDPFNVNQFSHPYQGATMFGLARSAGLNFWESWGYSNVGSFLWEMAGETTPPSVNDIVATGNAGSLLGEALFRMAGLVLEMGERRPTLIQEIGATAISPPLGFNRTVFGKRFKDIYPSHDPEHFWFARLGGNLNGPLKGEGSAFRSLRRSAEVDFRMSYGLPGKPGYTYDRPLDYFDFRLTLLGEAGNVVDNVRLRGLLYGRDYQAGDEYRGIWGLYGSYDYIAPFAFRVSTTALSLGTTGQLWMTPGIALQHTVMAGVGYGGAGTTPTPADEGRGYHYGITPQGVADLRFIFGDRTLLDLGVREWYVTGAGSDDSRGSERIFRGIAGVTVRVWKRHGIGVQYVASIRNAEYGTQPDREDSDGTVSLYYTYLGNEKLGAVRWNE